MPLALLLLMCPTLFLRNITSFMNDLASYTQYYIFKNPSIFWLLPFPPKFCCLYPKLISVFFCRTNHTKWYPSILSCVTLLPLPCAFFPMGSSLSLAFYIFFKYYPSSLLNLLSTSLVFSSFIFRSIDPYSTSCLVPCSPPCPSSFYGFLPPPPPQLTWLYI